MKKKHNPLDPKIILEEFIEEWAAETLPSELEELPTNNQSWQNVGDLDDYVWEIICHEVEKCGFATGTESAIHFMGRFEFKSKPSGFLLIFNVIGVAEKGDYAWDFEVVSHAIHSGLLLRTDQFTEVLDETEKAVGPILRRGRGCNGVLSSGL